MGTRTHGLLGELKQEQLGLDTQRLLRAAIHRLRPTWKRELPPGMSNTPGVPPTASVGELPDWQPQSLHVVGGSLHLERYLLSREGSVADNGWIGSPRSNI